MYMAACLVIPACKGLAFVAELLSELLTLIKWFVAARGQQPTSLHRGPSFCSQMGEVRLAEVVPGHLRVHAYGEPGFGRER